MIRSLAISVVLFLMSVIQVSGQDFAELGQRAENAVGRVLNIVGDRARGSGTGFVIGEAAERGSYFMITNEHVVADASALVVGFRNDDEVVIFRARVLRESVGYDLALLLITAPSDPSFRPDSLKLANRELVRGEPLFALGFPGASQILATGRDQVGAYTPTLTTGSISKVYEGTWGRGQALELVEHSTTINPGNSGGPLMDACGHVVGVNSAGLTEQNNTFLASSPNAVREFLIGSNVAFDNSSSCNPDSLLSYLSNRNALWVGLAFLAVATVMMVAIDRANGGGGARAVRRVLVMRVPAQTPRRAPKAAPRKTPERAAKSTRDKAVLKVVAPGLGMTVPRKLTNRNLGSQVIIGRSSEADIQIDNSQLSRKHAALSLQDRKLFIEDLGSSNGVSVDGVKLAANVKRQINTSSKIELGGQALVLSRP